MTRVRPRPSDRPRTRVTARVTAAAVAGGAGLASLLVGAGAAQAVSAPTVTGMQGDYVAGQGAGLPFKGVAQPYTITVKGTNFDSGAKVTVLKTTSNGLTYAAATASDVTVVSTVVVSATTLTVSLQVPATETASTTGAGGTTPPLLVKVTNGDTGTATCNAPTTGLAANQSPGCLTIHTSPTASSPTATVGRGATGFTRTLSGLSGLQPGTGKLVIDPAVNAAVAPFTITGAGDTSENAAFTVPASTATTATPADALLINSDGGEGATTVSLTPGPQLSQTVVNAVVGQQFTQSFSGTAFANSSSAKVTVTIPALFSGSFMATTQATTSTGTIAFGPVPSTPFGKKNVTVTNPDGGSATAALVNVVAPASAPAPASVSSVGDGNATIAWTVPGSSGSSSLVGYAITTTPDSGGVRMVPADQPTTFTLVGLTNGASYTASVRAINADQQASDAATTPAFVPMVPAATPTPTPAPEPTDSPSPTPTPTPTTAPPTASPAPTETPTPTPTYVAPVTVLTIATTKGQLALAQTTGFTGKVVTDGQPQSNIRVGVDQVGARGQLTEVAQGTTDRSGNWKVSGYTPVANAKYVASALGATSKSVAVNVALLLRLTDPQINGRKVTISGYATPGSSASNVKIVLFMTDAKGHRIKSIAAYKLGKGGKVKGYSLGASSVKVVRTFAPGKYHVVVQVYNTPNNTATSSKVYALTIT